MHTDKLELVNSKTAGLSVVLTEGKMALAGGMAAGFSLRRMCAGDSAVHRYQQTVEAHLIFLPAAGYRNGTSINNLGTNGNYWSSTLNSDNPNNARRLNFNSGETNVNNNNRYNGFSVRPVLSTCHLLRNPYRQCILLLKVKR